MTEAPAAPRPTHRLFIDESGTHGLGKIDSVEDRYLALLGVWLEKDAYVRFCADLQALKDRTFGERPDDPVVLHRDDILKKRGPFGVLKDSKVREQFGRGVLDVVSRADFKMCCCVIDKRTHGARTYRRLLDPYHYGLAALLERYVGLLDRGRVRGDVLAEARGKREDALLQQTFGGLYANGTKYHSAAQFQRVLTSSKIKMKRKVHRIAGLELADVLANPIRRHVIDTELGTPSLEGTFSERLVEVAMPKFNCNLATRARRGYGYVWLH